MTRVPWSRAVAALLFQPCLLGAPDHAVGGGESRREALRQDIGSCPALWGRALGGFSRRTELGILAVAAGAGVVISQFGGKITREARRHGTLRDFSSWGAPAPCIPATGSIFPPPC